MQNHINQADINHIFNIIFFLKDKKCFELNYFAFFFKNFELR